MLEPKTDKYNGREDCDSLETELGQESGSVARLQSRGFFCSNRGDAQILYYQRSMY